jgi:hypothetical protein
MVFVGAYGPITEAIYQIRAEKPGILNKNGRESKEGGHYGRVKEPNRQDLG